MGRAVGSQDGVGERLGVGRAKFRDHVRSGSDMAMKNEALLKLLCHNVVVHQAIIELGIEETFWPESRAGGERCCRWCDGVSG